MVLDKRSPLFPPFEFGALTTNNIPTYPDAHDYNTNAQSYYDKLAKDGKVLQLLADRIWQYDKTLDNSLTHIQEVLQNYSDILDEKIANFDQIVFDLTEQWLAENMTEIMTNATKMVWFGLNDDGHFIAVIPENWNGIDFDTTNNGELILNY